LYLSYYQTFLFVEKVKTMHYFKLEVERDV
jgi:hypothetical protein